MNHALHRILLINPPHTAIGSRIPKEQLPPLGLLSIGGPLIDEGFDVQLLDAEFGPMPLDDIVQKASACKPDVVLLGHSGSSSAHPTVAALALLLKAKLPQLLIVYGGVYPSYHWQEALTQCPAIDFIVRGEGEQTCLLLMRTLRDGLSVREVMGVAFREAGQCVATPPAGMIQCLDDYRVGWELVDLKRYSYWGGKRAVVAQFSRGCPYLCSYCGQRGFWTKWRYRDPVKFAAELAYLHREHGVELINFADELPTGSRKAWKQFLEALIAENVPLILVGSTRAGDIVRDADILHLYKKAGVIRFLLGIETYEAATLQKIKKGGSTSEDRQAIELLRQHGMLSMATYVVGFEEETDGDYWRSYRHLLEYDPDQIQLLYVTPHRWTPFFNTVTQRRVIQTDQRRWDYKHQVLATARVPPWRVFMWVKFIEVAVQLRPIALWRNFLQPRRELRQGMQWYTRMGRRVWFREVWDFWVGAGRTQHGPTVSAFWGATEAQDENAHSKRRRTDQQVISLPLSVRQVNSNRDGI